MNSEIILQELAGILKERGRLWIPARGFSMGPRWKSADALELEWVEAAALQKFDVAVFRRGDVWVAHRVVKIGRGVPAEPNTFLTKGDGMWHVDSEPVSEEQIVGRVTGLRFGDQDETVPSRLSFVEGLRLRVAWWRMARGQR